MNKAISHYYEDTYDQSLGRALGKEFSGNVKTALLALVQDPTDFYASRLKAAFKGFGTSETGLIELIVTKSYAQIQEGKKVWEARTDKSLIDYLDKELTSSYEDLQTLLFKLIKGGRDEGTSSSMSFSFGNCCRGLPRVVRPAAISMPKPVTKS